MPRCSARPSATRSGSPTRTSSSRSSATSSRSSAATATKSNSAAARSSATAWASPPLALDADCLDLVITNALILDAVAGVIKADVGIKDGRIVGIGHAGNPCIQKRRHHDHRRGDGGDRGRRAASSPPAASTRTSISSARSRSTMRSRAASPRMLGGGTGPATGTNATTCTPGIWNIHRMLEAADHYPMNLGFMGKGTARPMSRCASRSWPARSRSSCTKTGAPRPPPSDLPRRRRRARRPGHHPYRYAQRVRLRRGLDPRLQGPHDPHLPQRRRRRRPRAGHHQGLRRGECPALLDQSHAALHRQYHRRAPRHADGLPPSRLEDSRGCRLRGVAASGRETIAAEDLLHDLGAIFDDVERLAGDGPGRRSHHPHLADRA